MITGKRILCILLFMLMKLTGYAEKNMYLSLELAGIGGLGSINIEKNFLQINKLNLGWRAGFSLAPIDSNNGTALIFPVMLQAKWGGPVHSLEFSAGQALTVTTKGSVFILMPLSLGYRLEPAGKNYFLRVAYTPLVSWLLDWQWQHWGGISFGYRIGQGHE